MAINTLRFYDHEVETTTLTSTFTSRTLDLNGMEGFNFQISSVASPSVEVTVELQAAPIDNSSEFVTVQDGTSVITGTDKLLVEYNEPNFRYARVKLTIASGSAAITIRKQRKGI